MINWVVPLAYTTFGIQAGFLAFELFVSIYIFLYIDQDVFDEVFFEWGNRAWRYQHQPQTALSSFNNPMRYRASTAKGAEPYESINSAYIPRGEKSRYDPTGKFYPAPPGGWENTPSISDEMSDAPTPTRSRRGAAYSSNSDSLTPSETDTSTLNTTAYYGGAYAQSTVNSRRAGLSDVPLPAGSGGTSSSAPSWHAPTITSDSSTVRSLATSVPGGSLRNPTSLRRHSQPAMGARGRRGRSFSMSEQSEGSDEYMSARGRRMPTGRAAAARRAVSGPIDDLESNSYEDVIDEEHWHLREH